MSETVLLVDDSEFIRLNIRKYLEQMGHVVVGEARNGSEAIEQFMQLAPTVVTMDVIMPRMNGLQAMKQILDINPDVKILVVTAMAHEPVIKKALKMGAVGFITKPFTKADFVREFASIM